MNYKKFQEMFGDSMQNIAKQIYDENQGGICIKKEKTAVKNYEKIFNAVFKISYRKGFQAMSMRDLSNETNMSMGGLYRYFGSKEELLKIIRRQGYSMIKKVLRRSAEEFSDTKEKFKAVIKAHIFLSEIARPWFYFTFMEAKNLSSKDLEEVQLVEGYTENIVAEILRKGEKEEIFKEHDHLMTASMIKAMQQDWYLKRWKYFQRNISVDKYADFVLDFIGAFCYVESQP